MRNIIYYINERMSHNVDESINIVGYSILIFKEDNINILTKKWGEYMMQL